MNQELENLYRKLGELALEDMKLKEKTKQVLKDIRIEENKLGISKNES